MKKWKVIIIALGSILWISSGCEKQNNGQKEVYNLYKTPKYESPIALNFSYTTTTNGDYYLLAVLISKESTPICAFEIDVPSKFIIKGNKKWSGEIKSNIPIVIEIEVSKEFPKNNITGVFTASIWGDIFTVNQVITLNKKNKPDNIFIEKRNEKGEKIADFNIRK